MDDPSLLRYSRHLLLNEIGIEGQRRIGSSSVMVIGAGGLGSPAAAYLVAAGIGRLLLLDDDLVDLTNLQRQILHTTGRIGLAKVESAAQSLRALNPDTVIDARRQRADAGTLPGLLANIDVVVDCSDNRLTRYALNRACHSARIPLVSGAANGFSGQLAIFDFRSPTSPCYACLFPEELGADASCATTGIFAPLAGVIGALQAGEALKLLCGLTQGLGSALLTVDALDTEFRRLSFARNPACAVCSGT